jgi:dolichol-phosphate mannosyltransferase
MTGLAPDQIALSVIIPLRNEAEAIGSVLPELIAVLNATDLINPDLGGAWECLAVDDGSTDATAQIVASLQAIDPRVQLLRLDRPHGKTAALAVGFRAAGGDLIATMDGDGQCDPADLPRLIQALRQQGWDMARGVRPQRKGADSWGKRLASRVANSVRRRLLPDGVEDAASPWTVCRREALERIRLFEGAHRFFGSLALMEGLTVGQIPIGWRSRRGGRSKYGLVQRGRRGLADLLGVRWLRSRALRGEPFRSAVVKTQRSNATQTYISQSLPFTKKHKK